MIRANRILGLREFVKNAVLENLDTLGLIKPATPAPKPKTPDKTPAPKPKVVKAKPKAKAKKVASILLVFGLASFMFVGNANALLRPRNMDQVTTNTWTFQSVLIPSYLIVTGTTVYSGGTSFTGDVNIDAGLDVDTPVTSTIGVQFTTLSDAATAGEIGITAGEDVDIDGATDVYINAGADVDISADGDDVLIDAADDIVLDAVGVLDINCGVDVDAGVADVNGVQFTTVSDAAVAGEIGLAAGQDIDIDAGNDVLVDAAGLFSIDGAEASNVSVSGDSANLTLSSTLGSVVINATEAAAGQIAFNALSAVAGNGIILTASDSGIYLDANGSANGDVVIGAADDVDIDAVGLASVDGGAALDLDGDAIGIGDAGDTVTVTAAFFTQSVTNINVLTASMPVLTDASKNLASGAGYWATMTSDAGESTANTATDIFSIVGGGIATTAIASDEITITATEAQTLSAVCTLGAEYAGTASFSALTDLEYIVFEQQTSSPAILSSLWVDTDGVMWFNSTGTDIQVSP